MRFAAVIYFMLLGYCARVFGWDEAVLDLAGRGVDAVAARWALASDRARQVTDGR